MPSSRVMRNININKNELRKEYGNSVSSQALTDIIESVEREIKGVIEEKGLQKVKDDLQLIVDKIDREKMENFLKGSGVFLFFTALPITLAKDFVKENPMLALMIYFLIAMPVIVFGNALAFEKAINKVTGNLSKDIKEEYPLTLRYLQHAWKPRTSNMSQDSSLMQKRLVLDQMQLYIQAIELQMKPQVQINPRYAPT